MVARFARDVFRGAEAPRFHRLPRDCGAAFAAAAFAFFAKAGKSLLVGGSVSLQAREKLALIKGAFSPGSLPAARIPAEVREPAANELKRLTARMGIGRRASRV